MEEATAGLRNRLFDLMKRSAFKKGVFVLSSGKTSNYYLDARAVTLQPEGAYLAARLIMDIVKDEDIDAIGGPTIGADPVLGAIAALSHLDKRPIRTFIVRKAAKGHGMQRQIEGPQLRKGERVVLIDDVATTGKALIEAKAALDTIGVVVKKAIVIVDRDEGARANLASEGLELASLFEIKEFDS